MSEELIRRYYDTYNAVDVEGLADLLDEEVMLVSAMGTQEGRDAYMATYKYMTDHFEDHMEPMAISTRDDGDVVVRIRNTLTARIDQQDFMGRAVRAGDRIDLDLIGRYSMSRGRIMRIEISMPE